MKAKEKTQQPEKTIFTEMKQSDMTFIDRKIHDLLIAEGYRVVGTQRFDGIKLNNFTSVNRIEYRRGERERVFVTTNEPGQKETA
jgi:hypothetical protein